MSSRLLSYFGDDLAQKAPNFYKALCAVSPAVKGVKSVPRNDDLQELYLDTDEVFASSCGVGVLQRGCFKDGMSFLVSVSELYDQESGELLDTFSEYWEDMPYCEAKLLSVTQKAMEAANRNWRVVTTFSWSQDGQNVQEITKEFPVVHDLNGDPIVTEIEVTAPRAKNGKQTLVLYDREPQVSEATDYHYTNVMLPGRTQAKVHMPFAGRLRVADLFEIEAVHTSVEKPQLSLILENGGAADYGYDAAHFASEFHISDDKQELTWNFDEDWNTILDLSNFSVRTVVGFKCRFTLDLQVRKNPGMRVHPVVMVTSTHEKTESSSTTVEIEPIQIQWGCVEESTKIRMKTGDLRMISEIQPEDIVQTVRGTARVKDVIRGKEQQLVVLRTTGDHTLKMTESHPVETARGTVRAGELTAADRICTEDGVFAVKELYLQKGDFTVYNLLLDESDELICGGIITGDFEKQNSILATEEKIGKEPTELQKELRRLFAKVSD